MKIKGWELDYFNTGEWQVVDEKLSELEQTARRTGLNAFNPGRQSLFKALQIIPEREVRVCIIGQDPYPERRYATGVAFSVPKEIIIEGTGENSEYPPTLRTIFNEYQTDLHYPCPSSGNLERWSIDCGVLLWNAIPSCLPGKSLSHDWEEYSHLTREIIRRLNKKGIVYALLGQVARRYLSDIDLSNNYVVLTSHPSSRGSRSSNTPFTGSRLFSTINDKLRENGLQTVEWKLP